MRTNTGRVVLVILAAAVAGCHGEEATKGKAPTPVRVRTVAETTNRGATRYSGIIQPAARVDLAFKVGGYVREVAEAKGRGRKLQEGDFVTKGTVLAVVETSDYRERTSALRAAHAEAIANEKQSQVDFERAKVLLAEKAISQADFDAAVARRDVAAARTSQARAKVGESDLSLQDCILKAPFDGVVIRRNVEVGTLASVGVTAFTIADTRTVKATFGAPDVLLDRLHMGDKLAVRIEALGKELSGDITRIAPSADTKNRTFDIEATLDNKDDQLKVGMIVSIAAPEAGKPSATLALPLTAVVRAPSDPRGFAVFVVEKAGDNDVAHVREVKLGDVTGSAVVVTAGVAPGERVIETGTTFVADGERVRVVR